METKHLTKEEALLNEVNEVKAIEQKNVQLLTKFYKLIDSHNFDAVRDICSMDFKLFMNSAKEPLSYDQTMPLVKMFYKAIPNYKHNVEEIFACKDKVVTRILFTGTQQDTFEEIPATNNNIDYRGIQIFSFKKGLINEVYSSEDELCLMTNLGLKLQ